MSERITRKDVNRIAETVGVAVATYSPGDGATRYRFFDLENPTGTDYFGGSDALGTVLGAKDAYTWLQGYRAAQLNTQTARERRAFYANAR